MEVKYASILLILMIFNLSIDTGTGFRSNDPDLEKDLEPLSRSSRGFLLDRIKTRIEAYKGKTTPPPKTKAPDTKAALAKLFKDAVAEGGTLIVYNGGDMPQGPDEGRKSEFQQRYPNITIEIIIDFNQYQEARISNQLATKSLVPDVVQLQTGPQFAKWAKGGLLLKYQPVNFNLVNPKIKDADGAFTGISYQAIGVVINKKQLGEEEKDWPKDIKELLDSKYTDKLISPHPADDNAILYWYKQLVDKHGWEFVNKLVNDQKLKFVRGPSKCTMDLAAGESYSIGLATVGPAVSKNDSDIVLLTSLPFVSYSESIAIFKATKHPNTAKLYLNWLLEKETQAEEEWPARTDVPSPTKHTIWEYPKTTNPVDFTKFVADRAGLEEFKTQLILYVGEVQGESPIGRLDVHQNTTTSATTAAAAPEVSDP